MSSRCALLAMVVGWVGVAAPAARAQAPGAERPPDFASPEVQADRKVTFRIDAPKAEAVRLSGGDLPGNGNGGTALSKADNGVWEATVGPVPPGAYRYTFSVDGVTVLDPRNTATSESNANLWSLVVVPGDERFDTREVPHGAVAEVTYHSKTLGRSRRMHVYTPPGYERGDAAYPVLYLLHGAFDCDDSWSTVGRAGAILDHLVASGQARPMIVVMPAGHTGPFRFGPPGDNSFDRQMAEFQSDFENDARPTIEARYRVAPGRGNRAIAGLSMGGAQALNIAFAHLGDYSAVGVFSSGIFGIAGGFGGAPPNTKWEQDHAATLDDAALRQGLDLIWFSCGSEDFLLSTSNATVAMLRKHGLEVTSEENAGGHTWNHWRDDLAAFAPRLFAKP